MSTTADPSTTPRSGQAPPARAGLIIIAVGLSFVVANLDLTVVNIATATIQRDLHLTVSGVAWVINGYVLTYAGLLLLGGDLAARYGARRMYVTGVTLFTAASAAAGLAPTGDVLVTARVIQGIGAAVFQPASLILLSVAFPEQEVRNRMIGLWVAMGAVAAGFGPVVGGLLIGGGGWRGVFWVNLPIGALTVLLSLRLLPEARIAPQRRIRPLGHGLAALLLGGGAYALMQGPVNGWAARNVDTAIVACGTALVLFVVWQSRTEEPVYPGRLFNNRVFTLANAIGSLMNLGLFGIAFVLSLLLQVQRGAGPVEAGLQMLPMMLVFVIGNVAFTKLVKDIGTKRPMVFGMSVAFCATAALGLILNGSTAYWLLAMLISVAHLGLGFTSPAMTATMMSAVEQRDTGIAGAMLSVNRQLGSLIGVAVFSGLLASTDNWYRSTGIAFFIAAVAYLLAAIAATALPNPASVPGAKR